MIFLTLLYFSFFSRPWNTFALTTNLRPPQIFPGNHLQSIFIRNVQTQFGTRSIYGILWSCLSTIFTCTWIAVHPNIPAPGDSQWVVLRRRVAIMGYILIAPEMVIIWAGRQHYAARNFAKKHQEKHPGWTRVHAFFLIMGGFTLYEGEKPVRILEARELEELSEVGKIKWPTITEDEIADRSKGDYLSKTIVLLQTTWFIAQCIARGVYGLAVTELEVVTLAFATLTGVIYYFWWDKPLDVRCSIPVQLLEGRLEEIQDNVVKEVTGSQIISTPGISDQEKEGDEEIQDIVVKKVTGSQIISTPGISGQEKEGHEEIQDNVVKEVTGSQVISHSEVFDQEKGGDEKGINLPNPLPSSPAQGSTSTPDPALTLMQRFQAFRRRARTKYGTLFGLGYVFIVFPVKRFFGAFDDMLNGETLGDNTFRVPTFYSPPDNDSSTALGLGVCVSIVFGAIHCIAWSFHFATLAEQWAWRISAILVSGLPISIIVFSGLLTIFDNNEHKTAGMDLYEAILSFILISKSCLYIFARIALLVLPLVLLRALPPGAYVELDWVSFLPHI